MKRAIMERGADDDGNRASRVHLKKQPFLLRKPISRTLLVLRPNVTPTEVHHTLRLVEWKKS